MPAGSDPGSQVGCAQSDGAAELDDELGQAAIQLKFAELKDPVKDKLRRFGLLDRFDERHFFVTIGQAVEGYVESGGVTWEDWEERKQGPP